jgi:hypothetical protein
MYKCSECGLSVIVTTEGEKIKACNHEASIICEMEATATGKSSLEG